MDSFRIAAVELSEALDAESDVLALGDFETAATYVDRKRGLVDRFEAIAKHASVEAVFADRDIQGVLRRLSRASHRNERLLAAAREGFSQAERRVANFARQVGEVGVYGEDGVKVQFTEPRPDRRGREA